MTRDRIWRPTARLRVLTYQAMCQTDDPGGALREAATVRLIAERAQATGTPRERVRAEVTAFTGSAREHFGRDVATEIARLKRAAARGEGPETFRFEDLLAPRRAGGWRSCSPLGLARSCSMSATTWSRCGLPGRCCDQRARRCPHGRFTATSPSELSGEEAKLYESLLGPVDFQIPTPAVVRDGFLAPYQELAFFTASLASEREWLAERHTRFAELLNRLHEMPPPGQEGVAFGSWVIGRIRYRGHRRRCRPRAVLDARGSAARTGASGSLPRLRRP